MAHLLGESRNLEIIRRSDVPLTNHGAYAPAHIQRKTLNSWELLDQIAESLRKRSIRYLCWLSECHCHEERHAVELIVEAQIDDQSNLIKSRKESRWLSTLHPSNRVFVKLTQQS